MNKEDNNFNKCHKCNKIFSSKSYLKKHEYKKFDCVTKKIRDNCKDNSKENSKENSKDTSKDISNTIVNDKVVNNYFILVDGSEEYAMLVGKIFSEVLHEYIQKKQLLEQT